MSIVSMDGIGKTEVDGKPSSLKKYMSGHFSAFTFCQNDLEATIKTMKKNRSGEESIKESSESRASKFLKGKIVVENLERSSVASSVSSGRKKAAINRALISGLESVQIERP
jgi:hypothetical protein